MEEVSRPLVRRVEGLSEETGTRSRRGWESGHDPRRLEYHRTHKRGKVRPENFSSRDGGTMVRVSARVFGDSHFDTTDLLPCNYEDVVSYTHQYRSLI